MSLLSQLRTIEKLPTLPEVMIKVQKLVYSDRSDAASLAEIIKRDLALSSTILKTANSAYYNIVNRRISSISEAIARIGFNEVLKITMAVSVIEQFANTRSVIGYTAFWRHSVTAAGLTTIIADLMRDPGLKEYQQDLFLSGLLHDIGILIYDQFFHEEFTRIIDVAMHEEKTFLDSENEIFPKENHTVLGSALLEIWRLSLPIVAAVRSHHTPQKAPEKMRKIAAIVALAEYILCNSQIGSFEGTFELPDDVWGITGLSPENKRVLFSAAEAEAEKTDIMLNSSATIAQPKWQQYDDHAPLRTI